MTPNKNSVKRNSIVPNSDVSSRSVQTVEHNSGMMQVPSFVIETVASDHSNEEIDLRGYVKRVLRNKTIVAVITILLTLISAYYILTQPKVYQAEAKIQVDSENPARLDGMSASATTYDNRAYFNTQLQLLENPKLIRTIIKENDLETNKTFLDENFIEPILSPLKKSPKAISVKTNKGTNPEADSVAEAERLNPIVEAIQRALSVQPILQSKQVVKDTRLISVKFKHPDPSIAKLVANTIVDELVTYNLNSTTDANSSEREYLNDNIESLKAKIRRGEEQILQFGRRYQLPSESDNQNTVVERLVGLNRQLLEAENERKMAEAKYNAARAPGASEALAETGAKDIADIDAKVDDLQRMRAQLLVQVTEKHPEVQEIDKQIVVLKNAAKNKRQRNTSNFKTGLEVSYRQAVAREKAIRNSYDQQWQKTLKQNGAAINYRIIQQELESNRKFLGEMQQKEKESEMITAKAPNNIRVIEYALTPLEPINQQRMAYVGLALLASFSIGIAGALFKDYFSDPLNPAEDITKVSSIPMISSVSEIAANEPETIGVSTYSKSASLANDVIPESLIIENGDEIALSGNSRSVLADAFQQLKTVSQLSPDVSNTKSLLVTSAIKGEAQSTTLVNVAKSLAKKGASVLIVDADFRDPRIHKIFNCPNDLGLSNLLTEQFYKKNMKNLIVKLSENLSFLPSGQVPYNCSECLGSNRMRELMVSLEANFDYVIIDSPPVLFFADSSVLSRMVDSVLLTTEGAMHSRTELKQTRNFLTIAGANIVGVVETA